MALQKTITTPQGFDAIDAYGRVDSVNLLDKTKMEVFFSWYKDKTAIPFSSERFVFEYSMDGDTPIAQAYEHLKTLPEFAGAVYC